MLEKHFILGVHITNRVQEAVDVQTCLTKYGGIIKTRLGMHETEAVDDPTGRWVLELVGEDEKKTGLRDDLDAIEGVEVQSMEFDHPM